MWKFLASATIALMMTGTPVVSAITTQDAKPHCETLNKCVWLRDDVIHAVRSGNLIEVLQVIDGDTFWARAHLADGSHIKFKVRVRRIDAPEMKARCIQELEWALDSFEELEALLDEGDVELNEVGRDKYPNRIVAAVSTLFTSDVSDAMVESGHARKYSRGRRQSWCP